MTAPHVYMETVNAMLAGAAGLLDSGTSPAYIELYDGTRAAPGASATGNLLCTFTLGKPCGVVEDGVLSLNGLPISALVMQTGNPSWGRIFTGDGIPWLDADAGVTGTPDAKIIISAETVYSGGLVALIAANFT